MRTTRLVPLLGMVLLAIACGTDQPTPAEPASTTGQMPASTAASAEPDPAPESTTEPAAASTPEPTANTSGRPAAPDFTLAVDGGGEFRLADEVRPVFMVFWAEW